MTPCKHLELRRDISNEAIDNEAIWFCPEPYCSFEINERGTAMPEAKLNRMDLVRKVREIIDQRSEDPADELITLGEAMVEIGKALKGQSPAQARAILRSVQALEAT